MQSTVDHTQWNRVSANVLKVHYNKADEKSLIYFSQQANGPTISKYTPSKSPSYQRVSCVLPKTKLQNWKDVESIYNIDTKSMMIKNKRGQIGLFEGINFEEWKTKKGVLFDSSSIGKQQQNSTLFTSNHQNKVIYHIVGGKQSNKHYKITSKPNEYIKCIDSTPLPFFASFKESVHVHNLRDNIHYIMGGSSSYTGYGQLKNDIFSYKEGEDKPVLDKTDMKLPKQMRSFGAVFMLNYLVLFGGITDDGPSNDIFVTRFDANQFEWRKLQLKCPMPGPYRAILLSNDQRTDFLVFGYVHRVEKNKQLTPVPTYLTKLVSQYVKCVMINLFGSLHWTLNDNIIIKAIYEKMNE